MEYVDLAGSGMRVSRVGFGCEQLGGIDWGNVDIAAAGAAVRSAVHWGINFFDTADVYGLGKSEERLAEILGTLGKKVVVGTKFGVNWQRRRDGERAETFRDSSRRRVREALEGSLRRLTLDCIPLYQIHWPDPSTPIEETLDELTKCRREGMIGELGVSNFPVSLLRKACGVTEIATAQFPYSLLDRRVEEEALPFCRENGIALLAYGPLARGLLTGKYNDSARFAANDRRSRLAAFRGEQFQMNLRVVQVVKDVARKYGRTPAQVALRWVLRNPDVACVIVGAKTPEQTRENASVFGWDLSDEDYRRLGQAGQDRQAVRT